MVLACSSTWKENKHVVLKKLKIAIIEQQGNAVTDTNRLFHLDLVYFDSEELVFEVVVA